MCVFVTEDGDVTVLVAGASPLDANATEYEMINVYTTSGDIKVCNNACLCCVWYCTYFTNQRIPNNT